MRTETADVCVIGSGPGGAVSALRLAEAGLSTLVVERGPRVAAPDTSFREIEMVPRLYKDGGLQQNTSLDMFILQGSCVGGSAVLSNMVMLRPDDRVFEQWRRLGADLQPGDISCYFEGIEDALRVDTARQENVSSSTIAFMDAARSLGLSPISMNKALGDCTGCGYCNTGCPFGSKHSPLETYLPSAESRGARVLAETSVERIVHRRGRVQELMCLDLATGDAVRIRARQYVLSGGAINSSGLLLKSGIRKNVGTRLSFNGAVMLTAEYAEEVDGFDGDQMTMFYRGNGYIVEPTHNPLMGAALTTPGWFEDHGDLMKRQRNLAYTGVLVGTEATGRVIHSPFFGHEETQFRPTERDMGLIRVGLKEAARVLLEAGAARVLLPTYELIEIQTKAEIEKIDAAVTDVRRIVFGSSHPMGGNPWCDDPSRGVVDRDLAVHGFENLHVVDASVFPSCIGVNPIETIMAIAEYGSRRILARG